MTAMQEPQAHDIAMNIYLAYAQGDVGLATEHWTQAPVYLQPVVRLHLDEHIVAFDNPVAFEHCVGWSGMIAWLRDYYPHAQNSAYSTVQSCPRIMAHWWREKGNALWPAWSTQSMGHLLWMDSCIHLAAGNWHLWGSNEDHFVAYLSRFYSDPSNQLSPVQQEALKGQLDVFACANEIFMAWLRKQAFYDASWEDSIYMQTHNHHRHACTFDPKCLNPHSRAVAYYINQVRTGEKPPFSDGYWFFPGDETSDSVFARLLIAACPDVHFYCNDRINVQDPQHEALLATLNHYQCMDQDFSLLLDWLRSTHVATWGQARESVVGPW